MNSFITFLKLVFLIYMIFPLNAFSKTLNKIEIFGNDRITDETIKLFIPVDINDEINDDKLNQILKDLYETDFFEDVSIIFNDQTLSINVEENPIIENIFYEGIKSNRIIDLIKKETSIKSRSSYNENVIKKEKIIIEKILKNLGYYNSSLDILIEQTCLEENTIHICYV